jgi:hypothetical protein
VIRFAGQRVSAAVGLAVCLSGVVVGCGGGSSRPTIRVSQSVPRLRALLGSAGVVVGTRAKPAPLASAWRAFERFAVIPVSRGDLQNDPMADGLLFEAGTYDSGADWGRTFELAFVRQYAMKDSDLQQVHLVAHFAPAVFEQIRSATHVISCGTHFVADPPVGCASLCSYLGRHQLIGTPCRVVARGRTTSRARDLEDLTVWSYDTGGTDPEAQHESWLSYVNASTILRRALTSRGLLGYELWQDSAD